MDAAYEVTVQAFSVEHINSLTNNDDEYLKTVTDPQPRNSLLYRQLEVVAGGGIEPPTQGFSVLCSTN